MNAKMKSPARRAVKTVNVWKAQLYACEVTKHKYCPEREMMCSKANDSGSTGKEQTGHEIPEHSLRSSVKFANGGERN